MQTKNSLSNRIERQSHIRNQLGEYKNLSKAAFPGEKIITDESPRMEEAIGEEFHSQASLGNPGITKTLNNQNHQVITLMPS